MVSCLLSSDTISYVWWSTSSRMMRVGNCMSKGFRHQNMLVKSAQATKVTVVGSSGEVERCCVGLAAT